jgi:hypothetical protein
MWVVEELLTIMFVISVEMLVMSDKRSNVKRIENMVMFCHNCDKPSMIWDKDKFMPNCPHVPKDLRLLIL